MGEGGGVLVDADDPSSMAEAIVRLAGPSYMPLVTAAGIMVTNAGGSTRMGSQFAKQLGSNPKPMWIASGVLASFGLIPGLIIALLTIGPLKTAIVWVCSYAFQTVKDNILTPKIQGDVMGLHPLVVLLALLICAKLGGVVGILFALPLASAFNVIIRYLTHGEKLPVRRETAEAEPS